MQNMPEIVLGINACFAVKRFVEPDVWMRIIREDFDLTMAQLSLDLLPPATLDSELVRSYVSETVAQAKQHGVELHSIFTGLAAYSSNLLLDPDERSRDAAQRWFEQFIDLGAYAGVKSIGGHLGAMTVRDFRSDRRASLMTEYLERLNALSDYAQTAGLEAILFENLASTREPGSILDEAITLDAEFAAKATPLQLCFDVGHPVAMVESEGERELESWFRHEWQTTPMLQLQQSNYGSDQHGNFVLEGEQHGVVRAEHVLAELSQWNAERIDLFVEVIPSFEADDDLVLRQLKESVQYWQRALTVGA